MAEREAAQEEMTSESLWGQIMEDFGLYPSAHHPSPEAVLNWTKIPIQPVEKIWLGLDLILGSP